MSLRPQPPLPPVPDGTARIARAVFRRGNPYVLLRDRLGLAGSAKPVAYRSGFPVMPPIFLRHSIAALPAAGPRSPVRPPLAQRTR